MLKGKVLVTGAFGFFGRYICKELYNQGYKVYGSYHLKEPDNNDELCKYITPCKMNLLSEDSTNNRLKKLDINSIIHAAGYNGGIKFNIDYPLDIFSQNTIMGINLINAAANRTKIKKLLSIVTSCAYGEYKLVEYVLDKHVDYDLNTVIEPDSFLEDKPNETVACHGYAKRNLQLLSKYVKQQYGLNAITACVTTLYGPGDSLNLNKTKVMMALIKKFVDAKKAGEDIVTCWGTGKPHRQFIFVKDAAKCVVKALEDYNNNDVPVNISPLGDIRLSELVREISWAVDYRGKIAWDHTKPDGQMKKELVPHEMFKNFEFTKLSDGIKETVEWYQNLA